MLDEGFGDYKLELVNVVDASISSEFEILFHWLAFSFLQLL